MADKFETVEEYIAAYPPEVREVLEEVRRTIHAVVPGAGDKISYQIPTITLDGKSLVHFSGWKAHIALYPIPPVDENLAAAIAPYRSGKGTLKFPIDQPIPYELISRIAQAFVTARNE